MHNILNNVHAFVADLQGIPIPLSPEPLSNERFGARMHHLREELKEAGNAHARIRMVDGSTMPGELSDDEVVEETADAFMDIIYVAMGALIEMGVNPVALFTVVNRANLAKKRGNKPGRTDAYDVVKPIGWQPPDVKSVVACHGFYTLDEQLLVSRAQVKLEAAAGDWLRQNLQTELPMPRFEWKGNNQSVVEVSEKAPTPAKKAVAATSSEHTMRLSVEFDDATEARLNDLRSLAESDMTRLELEARALATKKDQDYGKGGITRDSYFPFGIVSYAQLMHMKTLRICSLVQPGAGTPNFESLEDSIKDLYNYTRFTMKYLETK